MVYGKNQIKKWGRDYCGQGVEEGCRGCKKGRRSYHSLKIGSGTGHL